MLTSAHVAPWLESAAGLPTCGSSPNPPISDDKPSLIECPLLMASTAHLDIRLGRFPAANLAQQLM